MASPSLSSSLGAHRRLVRLSGHLCPAPTAWMSELPVVRQDESGAMTSECLDELRGAMLEAAAAEDFRTAAQYKTMVDVLGPREPRPLSDFSSEDPDVAADLFLQHGVSRPLSCAIPSLIPRVAAVRRAAELRVG